MIRLGWTGKERWRGDEQVVEQSRGEDGFTETDSTHGEKDDACDEERECFSINETELSGVKLNSLQGE